MKFKSKFIRLLLSTTNYTTILYNFIIIIIIYF